MAVAGSLEIEGTRFNILSMDLSFNQSVDTNGKPNAKPTGGNVNVTVEVNHDSIMLMRWMINHNSTKDVKIYFSMSELGKSRVISLEKAFCIGYHEHFESEGTSSMVVTITISAQKLTCDDAVLEKSWYASSQK